MKANFDKLQKRKAGFDEESKALMMQSRGATTNATESGEQLVITRP